MKLTAARKADGSPITFHVGKRFRMKPERVCCLIKRFSTGESPYESMSGYSFTYTDEQGNPKPAPKRKDFFVPYELE